MERKRCERAVARVAARDTGETRECARAAAARERLRQPRLDSLPTSAPLVSARHLHSEQQHHSPPTAPRRLALPHVPACCRVPAVVVVVAALSSPPRPLSAAHRRSPCARARSPAQSLPHLPAGLAGSLCSAACSAHARRRTLVASHAPPRARRRGLSAFAAAPVPALRWPRPAHSRRERWCPWPRAQCPQRLSACPSRSHPLSRLASRPCACRSSPRSRLARHVVPDPLRRRAHAAAAEQSHVRCKRLRRPAMASSARPIETLTCARAILSSAMRMCYRLKTGRRGNPFCKVRRMR